jgi:hypothetical protein
LALAAAAWTGVLFATAAIVLTPLPAQAHAALISSSPADGDVVASVPTEVVFTFDDALGSPAFVSVVGPDGSNIADGDAVIDGATVTQAVRLFPQQGKYTASYRVVSDDGHPVTGTIRFTVDPAHATSSPSSTPAGATCSGDGCPQAGSSVWDRESTWVVVALVALAIGIAVVFAVGLRSGSTSDQGGDG